MHFNSSTPFFWPTFPWYRQSSSADDWRQQVLSLSLSLFSLSSFLSFSLSLSLSLSSLTKISPNRTTDVLFCACSVRVCVAAQPAFCCAPNCRWCAKSSRRTKRTPLGGWWSAHSGALCGSFTSCHVGCSCRCRRWLVSCLLLFGGVVVAGLVQRLFN
jgi:hypothetical protein